MRIMVLGAAGFIGRHIVSELLSAEHKVVAVVRRIGNLPAAFPGATFVTLDLANSVHPHDWRAHLTGIDAVINAAGLLRGRDLQAIHVDMPRALIAAAIDANIRHLILISAISARADVATNYSTSKLAGEDALRRSEIDWTILRPSLVYGEGSYGGTSLMRGMAGLPLFVPLPGSGEFAFTPIHVEDLARTVRRICEDPAFEHRTLEPVGPETLSLRELLQLYRGWLGFGRPYFLPVPMPLIRLMGHIGDVASGGPIATNSLLQMVAGNEGNSTAFADAIGFAPRGIHAALRDRPAQVQDRWHARLFFLAPALKWTLILMWLISAGLGLFHGAPQTAALVHSLGLPIEWGTPLRIGGGILDLGVAALLLTDRTARWSTPVQLIVVLIYTLVIGLALPALLLDPLAPLLKNLPIMLAIAVYGAIADRR